MRHLNVVDEQAKTELKVILEERNMRFENDPIGRFLETLNARFFYNHPYRLPAIGWEHEIRGLTSDDVRKFHQKWYAPNNAILIFAGDITPAKAKHLAEKYYGDIPAKNVGPRERLQEPPHRETIEHIVFNTTEIKAPYLLRMYQGPYFKTDNGQHTFSMQVLEYILQTKPWGILHQALVEDQKLAAFVQILHSVYTRDPNIFILATQPTQAHQLSELEAALNLKLKEIIEQGISSELAERAKRQMIASIIFTHDNAMAGAEEIGETMAIDVPLEDIDSWIEKINAVTVDQVNATARLVFNQNHHLTASLMPAENAAAAKDQQP